MIQAEYPNTSITLEETNNHNPNTSMSNSPKQQPNSMGRPNAMLPSRKSVDFAILPPSKRSRTTSVPLTAKQVVDGKSTILLIKMDAFEPIAVAM